VTTSLYRHVRRKPQSIFHASGNMKTRDSQDFDGKSSAYCPFSSFYLFLLCLTFVVTNNVRAAISDDEMPQQVKSMSTEMLRNLTTPQTQFADAHDSLHESLLQSVGNERLFTSRETIAENWWETVFDGPITHMSLSNLLGLAREEARCLQTYVRYFFFNFVCFN